MSQFTIDDLIKEAIEAHNKGDYINEKNAYQKLYDLYKHELGEKRPDTLNALGNLANKTILYPFIFFKLNLKKQGKKTNDRL